MRSRGDEDAAADDPEERHGHHRRGDRRREGEADLEAEVDVGRRENQREERAEDEQGRSQQHQASNRRLAVGLRLYELVEAESGGRGVILEETFNILRTLVALPGRADALLQRIEVPEDQYGSVVADGNLDLYIGTEADRRLTYSAAF